MNEISTKIEKLDLEFILDHFLNPKLWEKKWVIFNYNYTLVEVAIQNINVTRKTLTLAVSVDLGTLSDEPWVKKDTNWVDIPFDLAHRNIPLFERQIFNRAKDGMTYVERRLIRDTPAYKEAEEQVEEYKEKLRDIANEFLDNENVVNSAIRYAYIENYIENSVIPDFTEDVIELYRNTKIAKIVAMMALFFGYKDVYEEYYKKAKLNGFAVGHIRKEVSEIRKNIVTDEFVESLKQNLISIKEED